MQDIDESVASAACQVRMSDGLACGRPGHGFMPHLGGVLCLCIMHSPNPDKNRENFWHEIRSILGGTSVYHPAKNRFDFTSFVFPETDFEKTLFEKPAVFQGANFLADAAFRRAGFADTVDFGHTRFRSAAFFADAHFSQDAFFDGAEFEHGVDFTEAVFGDEIPPTSTGHASFSYVTFGGEANFRKVTTCRWAYFQFAKFIQDAYFDEANFTEGARFDGASFAEGASFARTVFGPLAESPTPPDVSVKELRWEARSRLPGSWIVEGRSNVPVATKFPAIADFRGTGFAQPRSVRFFQVNQASPQGLMAYLVNCELEGVRFEDVNWHHQQDRMVLADEVDISMARRVRSQQRALGIAGKEKEFDIRGYELVAIAYRQLVSNFERVRSYDWAEDCFIGAMEMKRLDPGQLWFSRVVVTLYKWASYYGSSYTRALGVLAGMLLALALLFPLLGLRMTAGTQAESVHSKTAAICPEEAPISWCRAWQHPDRGRELCGTLKAGALAAAEAATFQRRLAVEPATTWGRALAVAEIIVIPGQLALFFLALRRRFRR